jgi:hypothetical protein
LVASLVARDERIVAGFGKESQIDLRPGPSLAGERRAGCLRRRLSIFDPIATVVVVEFNGSRVQR